MAEVQSIVLFREINGYPGYWITSSGEVWSLRFKKRRKMSPCRHRNGHLLVKLIKDRKIKAYYVHRLVLEAFVGPCPEGMEACHFPNRDPSDNRIENLRWDTKKANKQDSKKHGTIAKGSRNGFAKLKEDEVAEMRRLYETGEYTQEELGRLFRVHQAHVSKVIRQAQWA